MALVIFYFATDFSMYSVERSGGYLSRGLPRGSMMFIFVILLLTILPAVLFQACLLMFSYLKLKNGKRLTY